MIKRKTMRPVTLRRVIEVCSLALKGRRLDVKMVSEKLNTSRLRAKEILLEVERMGLLDNSKGFWTFNDRTVKFLEYFEKEDWKGIHRYFLNHYHFYRAFIQILQDHIDKEEGLSLNEIKNERKANLNRTAIEVLSDWCERLGVIQRNLYTGKIYLIKENEIPSLKEFLIHLTKAYVKLSVSQWRREIFVKIPLIREHLCENLKISRATFNKLLKKAYLDNIGKIEFSGAPITTLAKKSPLREKRIKPHGKEMIMSTQLNSQRKREGITVNKKTYYYLAIH